MTKLHNTLIIRNLIGGGKALTFSKLRHDYHQGQLCALVRMAALAAFMMVSTAAMAQEPQDTAKVYVCTGSMAYAYHTHRNCTGLQKCTATVRRITAKEAKRQGRKFCGYCRRQTLTLHTDKEITKSEEIL